ncbi:MAG: DUF4832 domain-containing protein [Granulosicoccus sp.]
MKVNVIVRSCLLAFIWLAACASLNAATITYEPDDALILNPERGLAQFMVVGDESIGDITQLRADNHTIAWGIIKLESYLTNAVISDTKMAEIKNWLAAVRTNRVKAVLRVSYHEVQNFSNNDASLAVQEAHLTQLGEEVFVPFEDVIVALQAGGIGAYGEWYYANPDLTTSQSRKRLIDKMFEVSPDDAFVLVRTPYYKQEYDAAGALDDRVYRTGHYNDCFLSSADDTGTYACFPLTASCPTVEQLQSYSSNDSSLVPVGGETCNATPLNDCPATLAAMEFYGYSFINTLWFSSIRSKWDEQGCFDDIAKQLGYRYELISAEIPDSVSPGSEVSISVTLRNAGWAPIYHNRPVYIRLVDANGAELLYSAADVEPKNWFATDEAYTFTTLFQAPANLDTNSVSLSLWMPDNNPVNYRIPEYSVRFANAGVWDSVNGDNVLVRDIPVVPNSGSCDISYSLPTNQWTTLSLPCEPPPGTTVADLFADDIQIEGDPAVYGQDWVVFEYDPDASTASTAYVNPGLNGTLSPGRGFWIVQVTGSSAILDLPGGSTHAAPDEPESEGCSVPSGCVGLSLTGKSNNSYVWQLLGNPLASTVGTNALRVATANGNCSAPNNACSLSASFTEDVTSDTLWHYAADAYQALTGLSSINPWYGFWLYELPEASGNSPKLLFPASGGF